MSTERSLIISLQRDFHYVEQIIPFLLPVTPRPQHLLSGARLLVSLLHA